MLGVLLHHRRPAASSQRAPGRRRFFATQRYLWTKKKRQGCPDGRSAPGKAACWAPLEKGKDWQVGASARCTLSALHRAANAAQQLRCPANTPPGMCCPAVTLARKSAATPPVQRPKKPQGHGHRHAPWVVGFCLIKPICASGAGPAGP